jgi:hypothetical protein
MDDKELFESATAAEPVEEVSTEQPRDESGRFAPKAREPEVAEVTAEVAQPEAPAPEKPDNEAIVPSWRLREEREARETAERRYAEERARWERELAEVRANLPKPAPQPKPDLYENPDAFVDHGIRQALDPLQNQMAQLREFYSRREAVREHGQEKVRAAYDAVAQGLQSRDPEVIATYQRAMQSMDPFGDIVSWHQQKTVFSQIGNDPNAWFEKRQAELLKDPTYQAKLLQQIQGSTQSSPQKQNVIQLPPSLNKATGSSVTGDELDANDMSDRALFKNALRR